MLDFLIQRGIFEREKSKRKPAEAGSQSATCGQPRVLGTCGFYPFRRQAQSQRFDGRVVVGVRPQVAHFF